MNAIPADRIMFDDDDMAWWVLDVTDEPIRDDWFDLLDIPCDSALHDETHDCIDGRHTFSIDAECSCGLALRYRVAIVPGMVLPIVERHPFGPMTHADGYVLYLPDGAGQSWQTSARNDGAIITLPPAAKPGMWAVQLKVAS